MQNSWLHLSWLRGQIRHRRLTIFFGVAFLFVSAVNFEQGRVIDSQRTLIRLLSGDSTELAMRKIHDNPVLTDDTAKQVKALVALGACTAVFMETDDVQKFYEELSAKGVEFTDLPEARPYGIDCGFRDPFGNQFRVTQPLPE